MKDYLDRTEMKKIKAIESLIDEIISSDGDIDELIVKLSKSHNVLKAKLTDSFVKNLSEKELKYIQDLNNATWDILNPVYDTLIEEAFNNLKTWYGRIMEANKASPVLFDYQLDLARWLLSAIIKNELSKVLYTLLISRGGFALPYRNIWVINSI